MRKKILVFLVLLTVVFLNTSCARVPIKERPSDYNSYKEKLKEIDKSDGISREEAVIIAQNYAIEQGLDKNYLIAKPAIEDFQFSNELYSWNEWRVIFKATFGESIEQGGIFGFVSRWWIDLHVDKTTGEVRSTGGPDL